MAPRPDTDKPGAGSDARENATGRILAEELAVFSARAGHDLLGPLNQAASLLALFITRYRDRLDSQADVLLDHVGNAALKMESVVEGVRNYLNAAATPPEYRLVDLHAPLASALAVLDPVVKASEAAITTDPLPSIRCGREQIAAIFEILIDNAIKFRRPAEVPRIHISAIHRGDDCLVAVADNGIGFEPKYSEDVLLPFRRLNGREYPGAGLGLATANLIARLHGGSLRIESATGTGTTATLTLPVRAGAA